MTCCTCITKSGLTIINLLFCVIGAALIFLGAFIFAEYSGYRHDGVLSLGTALLPALILIVVGFLSVMLGMIGCVATCRDQKCLTGLYFTLLLLLLLGLIAGGVLSFLYRRQIDDGLHKMLKQNMDNYFNDKFIRDEVDFIQKELKCCGVDNATDWLETSWHANTTLPYPSSCCVQQNCTYDEPRDERLYNKGCYTDVKKVFKHDLFIVGCVAGGFALVLLLGMVLSCVLIAHKRRNADIPYIGLPDSDGMRI